MKTGDKVRIMTSCEYKKYVASHDVPDLFTGTFAEKYMGKQGLIKGTYVRTTGVTWCKVSTGRSTYPWPDYMLIKVSGIPIKGGITSKSFSTSGEIVVSKEGAKKIKAILERPQKYAIASSISEEEMRSRLNAFTAARFKEATPHDEKAKSPFELTEIELKLFGLSKMDALLWAIADPTLEVEVNIRRKKDALTISKSIELHDADTDNLVLVDLSSIAACKHIDAREEERWDHHYANAVITFTDGHKEYFRESPIQIRKKIREASL